MFIKSYLTILRAVRNLEKGHTLHLKIEEAGLTIDLRIGRLVVGLKMTEEWDGSCMVIATKDDVLSFEHDCSPDLRYRTDKLLTAILRRW